MVIQNPNRTYWKTTKSLLRPTTVSALPPHSILFHFFLVDGGWTKRHLLRRWRSRREQTGQSLLSRYINLKKNSLDCVFTFTQRKAGHGCCYQSSNHLDSLRLWGYKILCHPICIPRDRHRPSIDQHNPTACERNKFRSTWLQLTADEMRVYEEDA